MRTRDDQVFVITHTENICQWNANCYHCSCFRQN